MRACWLLLWGRAWRASRKLARYRTKHVLSDVAIANQASLCAIDRVTAGANLLACRLDLRSSDSECHELIVALEAQPFRGFCSGAPSWIDSENWVGWMITLPDRRAATRPRVGDTRPCLSCRERLMRFQEAGSSDEPPGWFCDCGFHILPRPTEMRASHRALKERQAKAHRQSMRVRARADRLLRKSQELAARSRSKT